jgi:hypothetical protein
MKSDLARMQRISIHWRCTSSSIVALFILAFFILAFFLLGRPAFAQAAPTDPIKSHGTWNQLPSDSAQSDTPKFHSFSGNHPFWDRTNIFLFSGVALFRGLDYTSTRNFQARGRGEVLLAPEVVNNSAAFAGLEAAGTATSVGVSYIFHRTGHHKLERWLSIAHISVAGVGDGWNYSLKTHRPK